MVLLLAGRKGLLAVGVATAFLKSSASDEGRIRSGLNSPFGDKREVTLLATSFICKPRGVVPTRIDPMVKITMLQFTLRWK